MLEDIALTHYLKTGNVSTFFLTVSRKDCLIEKQQGRKKSGYRIHRIQDTQETEYTGYRIRDTGYRIQDTHDTGYMIQDT